MVKKRRIRVLVIDDSAYNRKTISQMLDREPDIEVIGKACDGEQGLEMAFRESPDAITLDLEMPRMGGFPFLRILMSKKPIPVIVISSHTKPEKVIRALELGAFDFVSKPTRKVSPDLWEIWNDVVTKVRLAGGITNDFEKVSRVPMPAVPFDDEPSIQPELPPFEAHRVVAIAASTGGPQAITEIISALPENLPTGIVMVQHMPPRFTTSFAERLDKISRLCVLEPTKPLPLKNGTVYLAPGQSCMEVIRLKGELRVEILPPNGDEIFVPSGDRLFSSVARAVGGDALGIVLTGMGRDGSVGAKEMSDSGAMVIAEDEATAVIPGMPTAAISAGAVQVVAPLERMAAYIEQFAYTGRVG